MKKCFCILAILAVLVAVLAGCGKEETNTTLMIYMMGSDLEPKAGAASSDLQEIAESGIDLEHNQVVVCAGASPFWHNEKVDAQKINIMTLQEQGFTTVSSTDSASMGTAEQLQSFLDYCWQNYPNEEFALILWDHGNGPVMGYGKDILYGSDALLLTEIRQALANSAFTGENKLAWVGFDACLMASAELSCMLADHANYLIASQEIEPAFGWDYQFLAQLGKTETPALLKTITEDYMAACQVYYKDRGYEHYDVTLAAVDLSCAADLESAINDLFSAATREVEHYYDLLAMNRVQTRALGRATTGSEYDLVDLQDMVKQLESQYPTEAAAVTEVIHRMVLANATSMDNCCGMSLYYPFFNKYYYEKDWKKVYSELGIFPEYQAYLTGYETTWLKEDKLEMATFGAVPEETAENTFSVTLSDQQAKSFGSAVYHILKRESGDVYRQVYTGQDVTFENNTLTTKYDGGAIYVCQKGGEPFITPVTAIDNINRLYRYSGIFGLNNMTYKPENATDEELPEETTSNWRYLLTYNSETGKVEMSGTVPLAETTTQDLLESGRVAEADLSKYGGINFYYAQSRYITRYDNGVIKPLSQWYSTGVATWQIVSLAQGYSFEYAPLANGEYYVMFEIRDTQSGVYCTELLPITVENEEQTAEPLPVTQVTWKQGEDKVILKEQDNVKVFLTTKDTENGGTRYFLEVENTSDLPVEVKVSEAVVNETLLTDGGAWISVDPYDFMYEELTFGIAEGAPEMENLRSLRFTMDMEHDRSGRQLWEPQSVLVDMTNAPPMDRNETYQDYFRYEQPYMGAKAEKQVIYESDSLRLTLMGIGVPTNPRAMEGKFYILAENLSDKGLNTGVFGCVINGYYMGVYGQTYLPAGKGAYLEMYMVGDQWKMLGFDQIHTMTLMAAASEDQLWWKNETACIWCPVVLEQAGQQQDVQAKQLLWEDQGVKVSVFKEQLQTAQWYLLIENNSQEDLCLDTVDVLCDGERCDGWGYFILIDPEVGAGQKTVCQLYFSSFEDNVPPPKQIDFKFQLRTFDESKVLFTAAETTTLRTEKGK